MVKKINEDNYEVIEIEVIPNIMEDVITELNKN